MKFYLISNVLLGIFIFYTGCKGSNSNKYDNDNDKIDVLHTNKICKLNEDSILGNIESFAFIDSLHFIVASNHPPMMVIYDTNGTQLRFINKKGRGPYEFLDISLVRVYKRKIYTWCNKQLKLIVFDEKGRPIREYKGFKKAIKDFIVLGNIVVFYTTGGFKDAYIEIYDLNQRKVLKKFGIVTNEHILLDIMRNAGGLSSIDSTTVCFTSGSELKINKLNLKSFELQSYGIKDIEFNVVNVKQEASHIINENREFVFKYINENSIVTDLLATTNKVVIKAEVGKYIRHNNGIDFSKRFFKYYIVDNNGLLEKTYKCKISNDNLNELLCVNGQKIYLLKGEISERDFIYTLETIQF